MKIPPRAEIPLRQFACEGRSTEWMIRWCAAECGFRVRRRDIVQYMKNVVFADAMAKYILGLPIVKRGGAFPFPATDLDELDAAIIWAERLERQADVRGLVHLRREVSKLKAWAHVFRLRVAVAAGVLSVDELAPREQRLRESLGDLKALVIPFPLPPPPRGPRLVR